MTSPPRRMTRARAKQEGYEPDWRINPQWKTPKKAKPKHARFAEPDVDTGALSNSVLSGGAERVPSPNKIRIPAQMPLQQSGHPSGAQGKVGSEIAHNTDGLGILRRSVLGSPVRVRPNSNQVYNSTVDKENSPMAAPVARVVSKKPVTLNTSVMSPRSRPLEGNSAPFNTQQETSPIKVLSTPIRILNPQTPGRPLGSPRRIPIKIDKTNSKASSVNPVTGPQDPKAPRNFTYPINSRLVSPGKSTVSATRKSISPMKTHGHPEVEFIEPAPTKTAGKSQKACVTVSRMASVPENSPDSTHWTPLKSIPPLQRKSSIASKLPQSRPSKALQERPLSSRFTKQDFYVDESFSNPTKPGSTQRLTPQIPKFPIRRRPIYLSTSLEEETLSKSETATSDIDSDVRRESKASDDVESEESPTKSAAKKQLARELAFPARSSKGFVNTSEIPSNSKGLSEVLSERPSSPDLAPTGSTTPHGTPQPLSPKIFDFSDTEDAINLFTPRKAQRSPLGGGSTLKEADVMKAVPLEVQINQRSEEDCSTCTIPPTMQTPNSQSVTPRTQSVSEIHERPQYQQDIIVPVKDACPGDITPTKSASTMCSTKPSHMTKTSTGPLRGVIAYVDVRTADGDDAGAPFTNALKNMGAKVVRHWAWNGEGVDRINVTHVIFKQGGPRTLSKVKLAKGAVKCVGLGWVSRYTTRDDDLTTGVKQKDEKLMKTHSPLQCHLGPTDIRSIHSKECELTGRDENRWNHGLSCPEVLLPSKMQRRRRRRYQRLTKLNEHFQN